MRGSQGHLADCHVLFVKDRKQFRQNQVGGSLGALGIFGGLFKPQAKLARRRERFCVKVAKAKLPLKAGALGFWQLAHAAAGARMFNLTLADWGSLLKGVPENEQSGCIEIDLQADEQKISLKDHEGNVTLWETYSVAGKVLAADMLDLKKLNNHFILSVGTLGEQLIKEYDLGCDKKGKPIKLTLDTIGDFFRNIQSGKIKVKPVDGHVSFDDLKKYYAQCDG